MDKHPSPQAAASQGWAMLGCFMLLAWLIWTLRVLFTIDWAAGFSWSWITGNPVWAVFTAALIVVIGASLWAISPFMED